MKRVELRTADHAPFLNRITLGFGVVIALVFVGLLTPLVLQQMQIALTQSAKPKSVEQEAWPTLSATYAPPAVADLAPVRDNPTQTPAPTPTPLPPPIWRELSYLTSIEFTTSSVVEAQHTTDISVGGVPLFDNVLTDRLLLKAVGKVQLGVDLSQVSAVKITGTQISLVAPSPEVTSVELLPGRSQIYDSVQVWLLSQYQGLEKDALEKARLQLRDEVAQNESMMKMATEMSRLQLTEFLHKAGFTTVQITFKPTNED